MKLRQIGRITLAAAMTAAIVLGASACSEDYTIDYLYVTGTKGVSTSSPDGYINAYKVDNQSGSLTQMVDSPYSSGGINPVDVILSPNGQALYVLNETSSTIEVFLIGTDGKIYPQATYNLGPAGKAGSYPIAGVVDPTNTYLFVLFNYQSQYSTNNTGPGGIAIFPISGSSACPATSTNPAQWLCTPLTYATNATPYYPVGNKPTAIGVSPLAQIWRPSTIYTAGTTVWDGTNVELATSSGTSGSGKPGWAASAGGTTTDGSVTWKNESPIYSYIYAVDQETSGGQILGFLFTTASGSPSLTALPGTTVISTPLTTTSATGYAAGVTPYAIAEDPTGRFVYVTDQASNQVVGYVVQSTGALQAMVSSPFSTGQFPQGITVDPRGEYVYVTNYNSGTVNGYAINLATGSLSGVFSNGVSAVGTGPKSVTIEPSFGIYLYTANYIDNTATGLQLDPHTGALENIQNTPFNATGNPTSVVAASSGSHAFQAVQP
jgi:DNA-binding beta-propeller fold protein YncE